MENLKHEGVPEETIFLVGNVMIDSLLRHRELAARSPLLDRIGVRQDARAAALPGVLTLHRPSNVDDSQTLKGILSAVSAVAAELPVFFPVHPRTRKNIEKFGLQHYLVDRSEKNAVGIVPLEPLGYLDFLALNDHSRLVLTDSGGVQEETTVLEVPCLTLRENTERPATVEFTQSDCGSESGSHTGGRARHSAQSTTRFPVSATMGRQISLKDCGDSSRTTS